MALTTPLAPWLAHAQRCVFASLDDLAEPNDLDEDLWLAWDVGDGDDAWITTLEAIELLDLFVRVDYHGAWSWILEMLDMRVYIALLDQLPMRIYPKHTIAWKDSLVSRAEQFVFGIPDERHTPGFCDVRNDLLRRWEKSERSADERIRVCVEVDLDALDEGDEPTVLNELVQLAALAQDPFQRVLLHELTQPEAAAPQTPSGVFHVQWFDVSTGQAALTDALVSNLRAIDELGVTISNLVLGMSVGRVDDLSARNTVDVLRALVLPTGHTTTVVVSRQLRPFVFEAICSALVATQSVNDVGFTLSSEGVDYWAWIAYTLFSGDVPNSLEYVHVRVESLTRDDVATVQRVLEAHDPLAAFAVASTPQLLQRTRAVVDVGPNTYGFIRNHNATEPLATLPIHGTDLRVVDDAFSSTHVCVLYPGAGLVWIPRDRIVARRTLPARSLRPKLRRISVELYVDTSLDVLLALIQVVGPLARILLLYAPYHNELSDAFLFSVLDACPDLERLDLVRTTVSSFTWLSDHSATRLDSLRCTRVRCMDPQGYLPLLTALRDPDAAITRSLRELALCGPLENVWPTLSALGDTLRENYRLHRAFIRTDDGTASEDVVALGQQLQPHDGEPLHVQEAPLSLRSRLAFVSALRYHQSLPELDAAVLSIIFTMAAPNKHRACGFMRKLIQRTL